MAVFLPDGTTDTRMHPVHLHRMFTVSLPFRQLAPLLSLSSTEGRAAFRGIARDSPWLRKADEIGYYHHVLWFSSLRTATFPILG